MFESSPKSVSRRAVIREKCPDRFGSFWRDARASGAIRSIGIAVVFAALAVAIIMLREDVVPYRPGQYVPHDILSRVNFVFHDKSLLDKARQDARLVQPRVYKANGDFWGELEKNLNALPERLAGKKIDEVDPALRSALELDGNTGALSEFEELAADAKDKAAYEKEVAAFVQDLAARQLIIVSEKDYRDEWDTVTRRHIVIPDTTQAVVERSKDALFPVTASPGDSKATELLQNLRNTIQNASHVFPGLRANRIVAYTVNTLRPTYVVDAERTIAAQNAAATGVQFSKADQSYVANQPIFLKGQINERDWQILRAEKEAFNKSLGQAALKAKLGLAATVILTAAVLCWYIGRYQQRIIRNPARAVALGALLVSMLLMAQLAAIGTGPLYVFGLAPTILVAMIIAIAYDQRFAIGVASMHGIIVTAALDQGIGFFLILWVGILTCGFLLDQIRTRSKLIEVGGATALAMIAATIAAGATAMDPLPFIAKNCLYTGAAGLSVGFLVLGILPFIEKAFKITTGMTLLELADASQPLLRRLSLEAPGTYNHSLQVATLAEAAADAIGANSLLCRVAAYYHDIGKINKPDYFIENQTDGRNRHLHLSANMSFHIIHGHVKDGMALAKEYNLPSVILPFIQQHHGTTVIEYFFDKAKKQMGQLDPDGQEVTEMQFRYGGPKPKNREIAILMLADAAESATRAEKEPSHARIEDLIHTLSMKRLLDGQFDESDLTMRDLELVERTLVKTLTGIYHGRIAYPTPAPKVMAPRLADSGPESITA
jgi:putative nucleotidyltransferase with HDIG domain